MTDEERAHLASLTGTARGMGGIGRYHDRVDAREFVGLALDPVRLSLLGRAAEGTVDVEDVAAHHGVSEKVVLEALGRLRSSGLIDGELRLDRKQLRSVAATLPQPPPAASAIAAGSWTRSEADVLSRFFSGNRLVSIPTSRPKRRVVLERIAQEFEPGLRYEEAAVNVALQMFHADHAALRRLLVDEGLLSRGDGVYWRTGGRFEPVEGGEPG